MTGRLRNWVLPPLVLVTMLSLGHAAFADAQIRLEDSASFTLEIRGLGMVVDRYRQGAVLGRLDETGPQGTLLSQNPRDYAWSRDDRSFAADQREGNALEYALRNGGIERWPIPTLVIGPSRNEQDKDADRIDSHLVSARQKAGLGITLFVQLGAMQANDSDSAIRMLFQAFEQHPELPAVLVLANDGVWTRNYMGTPGAARPENGNTVPKQPDSIVALLVSRKDRVDRDIRPYVVDVPYKVNLTDTQYDVIKLWNYYWAQEKVFDKRNSGFMTSTWWQQRLPELQAQVSNRGPGDFKPNPWVPIRWTDWQLKQYDDAPLLGYLHRPVEVSFVDGEGVPLKRPARVAKLKDGWAQAMGTLQEGQTPARVVFDPGSSADSWIVLTQALHGNPQNLDLDDAQEGFNTAQRVGDTGTASPWVQIGIAVMRGYEKGGTTATVNIRDSRRASIVMVSPPDDAYRQKHSQLFDYSVK
ncbi:type VI lipase adapter Tla3 domain-containing protein [Paraburkholderia bannensis]|uniref:type VI lipase adapter Tla3 domain-containing protein n=1 Tax=Paraburkholderia bannensis TaxID=765414 RepID=UPI002AB5FFC4|nr:DUF2875 family protein [Paraburkholderia bannensis]